MDSSSLTELLLTGVAGYGVTVLAAGLFAGGLGIPIPTTLLVLMAGAFIRQGVLDAPTAIIFGLVAVVLGDSGSYAMGYFAKDKVQHHFGHSPLWLKAQATITCHGGLAIYLSRFLLTPLAIPVNLIAGSSAYPYRSFLLFDIAGELTWFAIFGSLGYLFASQWEVINQFISDFTGMLVGVVALVAGVYGWHKRKQKKLLQTVN
ncbi:MAG: DedA family protein [Thiolinea sp.]